MLRDGGGDRRPGLRRDARSLDRRNCGTPVRWSGWVAWEKDDNVMIVHSDAESRQGHFRYLAEIESGTLAIDGDSQHQHDRFVARGPIAAGRIATASTPGPHGFLVLSYRLSQKTSRTE